MGVCVWNWRPPQSDSMQGMYGKSTRSIGSEVHSHSVRSCPRQASTRTTALRNSFLGEGRQCSHNTSLLMHHTHSRTGGSRRVTTMAAKVTGYIKLALEAGKASPAPPVGPALGSKGVNIMGFCKEYNAATQDKMGTVIPVEITVYEVSISLGA